MGIDQSTQDLKQITETLSTSPPATLPELTAYLRDNLLPWLESLVGEIGEMDEAIEDIVHQSVDVLHPESAAVFAGIITGGAAIATELAQRAGNDHRILSLVKEFRALCRQGSEILEEIVLPDDEEEEEDDDDEGEDDEEEEGADTAPVGGGTPPKDVVA